MGFPARGDEMVQQEPETLVEAEEHADQHVARYARWAAVGPAAALITGGLLYAQGRRSLGAVAAGTAVVGVAGSLAFRFIRGHQERDEAMHDELEELDEERAAIETGRA